MKRIWHNAATDQSIPTTAWSQPCSKRNGIPNCASWKRREPSKSNTIKAISRTVSVQEHAEVNGVPVRFRQFWNDPKTTVRERKRAVRFLLEDVTVHKSDQIVAHMRFKGGATQTITVPLPPPFAQSRLTAPETLAAMDRLLEEYTDAEVAEQLNQQGYRTFDGLHFQSIHVYQLRRHHGIPDRYARLRAQGMLTAEELARNSGVSAQVIWRRYHQGRIVGVRYNDRGSCLFLPPGGATSDD